MAREIAKEMDKAKGFNLWREAERRRGGFGWGAWCVGLFPREPSRRAQRLSFGRAGWEQLCSQQDVSA